MTQKEGYGEGLLIRPSPEFVLKSNRTRRRLVQRWYPNLRNALESRQIDYRMSGYWNALLIQTAAVPRALEVLQHVAGVGSIVGVDRVVRADVEEIARVGAEVFAERVAGRRLIVRARRSGKRPFSSRDVEVALGAALRPAALKVDLTHSEIIEAFRGIAPICIPIASGDWRDFRSAVKGRHWS